MITPKSVALAQMDSALPMSGESDIQPESVPAMQQTPSISGSTGWGSARTVVLCPGGNHCGTWQAATALLPRQEHTGKVYDA